MTKINKKNDKKEWFVCDGGHYWFSVIVNFSYFSIELENINTNRNECSTLNRFNNKFSKRLFSDGRPAARFLLTTLAHARKCLFWFVSHSRSHESLDVCQCHYTMIVLIPYIKTESAIPLRLSSFSFFRLYNSLFHLFSFINSPCFDFFLSFYVSLFAFSSALFFLFYRFFSVLGIWVLFLCY